MKRKVVECSGVQGMRWVGRFQTPPSPVHDLAFPTRLFAVERSRVVFHPLCRFILRVATRRSDYHDPNSCSLARARTSIFPRSPGQLNALGPAMWL